VPEIEALLPRLRAANTQVLGVSVDSVYSHANWGKDLGGVSFPLLSDFQPKGGTAQGYGLYLEEPGITDRATVIIDSKGVVRYADSVGPGGRRDTTALVAKCEQINGEQPGAEAVAEGKDPHEAPVLYVKSQCGFSRAVLLARDNLHLGSIPVKNVSEDDAAKAELEAVAGSDKAPCLIASGKAHHESAEIILHWVNAYAPI
jgi:AhpC/TSA family